MLILSPPSEGKSSTNTVNKKFNQTDFVFKENVKTILNKLTELNEKGMISVYGTALDKAKELHQNNLNIFNNECSMAIDRYTGVIFKSLDWKSLNSTAQTYINQNMRIFSGLFGILKPNTLIPNYKLKMDVLSLAHFWKPHISNHIKNEDIILDLLPAAHRKAINVENNIVRINFMTNKNGSLVHSAHSGKVVKGKFIRFLAQNNIDDLDGIRYFQHDGYKWNGKCFLKNG